MSGQHTPEPWKVGHPVPTSKANARRIVACVNACAGIETESLEADGYGDNWAEIRRQRDAFHDAEITWELTMMAAIGEDGPKSVAEAIARLKADRAELLELLKGWDPGELSEKIDGCDCLQCRTRAAIARLASS